MSKPTTSKTATPDVTALAQVLAQVLAPALAQYSTPVAVAEAVVAEPTAREKAHAYVTEHGYGMAKGGEQVITADALTAAARVLRNGGHEIVSAPETQSNTRRGIVSTLVYATDDRTLVFHPLYRVS